MAGDMNLRHPVRGDAVDIRQGIKTVVSGGNIDVVDVQENSAVGPFHDFVQELPFGHFRHMVFGIAADILNGDRDFEKIPDLSYLLCRDLGRFKSVWHRKQAMGISPVHAAPPEMIRHPRRAGWLDALLNPAQITPTST